MESPDRKLRHDIRGTFHALLLSTEVLRGALPAEDCDMFLDQVVEACEKLDQLMSCVSGGEDAGTP